MFIPLQASVVDLSDKTDNKVSKVVAILQFYVLDYV